MQQQLDFVSQSAINNIDMNNSVDNTKGRNLRGSALRLLRAFSASTPTILVLNDTRDQTNWGSKALVIGLEQILLRVNPKVRFEFLLSEELIEQGTKHKTYNALLPTVADEFEYVARQWQSGSGGPGARALVPLIEKADAILFNGEGSIYRNNHSAIKGLFISWYAKSKCGKPTAFVNGGVHLTLVEAKLPAMVRKTFGALDAVTVREPFSLRCLNEYAPNVQAKVIPDSAFFLEPETKSNTFDVRRLQENLAGRDYFCLSAGQMPFDYRHGNDSALQSLIRTLKTFGLQAVLLANAPEDKFLEQVACDTDSFYFFSREDYRTLMTVLSGSKFQLSGRYHHLILGARVGCPAIPFAALSHKIHGVCELLEREIGTPFDSTDLFANETQIIERAKYYCNNNAACRESLRTLAARLASSTLEIGAIASSLLESPRETRSRHA